MKYTVLSLQIRYRLVKVLVKALCPSVVEFSTTAATNMLYFDPGVKSVIVVLVMLINMSSVHQTLYDSTLPSGLCQLKETDDVVTLVMVRFSTVVGTKNSRYTNKVRATNSMHHLIFSSEELYSVTYF